MDKQSVRQRILEIGIVPVVRASSAAEARLAAEALVAGGIPCVEITMTVPGAIDVIGELSTSMGDRVLIGAGTVLDAATAAQCVAAGARFLVSPGFDASTVAWAVEHNVLIGAGTVLDAPTAAQCVAAGAQFLVSPGFDASTVAWAVEHKVLIAAGALTPTEVITAWRAGADFVKIFPCANVGGAKYIKALRGPLPQVPLIPTGGVNLETAVDFLKAGSAALGVGGELVLADALKANQPERITDLARKYVALVKAARNPAAVPVAAR